MKRFILFFVVGLVALVSIGLSQTVKDGAQSPAPQVAGDWKGTWGLYAPPVPGKPGDGTIKTNHTPFEMQMVCKVELQGDGKYQATFEGDAGRPYKYVIKMPGRQVGNVALFSGTVDLGEKDGGVYDWIGRATDKEFIGFFTSKGYTGTFRLARPPKQ